MNILFVNNAWQLYVIVFWLLQLEKYKAKRSSKDKDASMEQSDDESLHNEKSMLHKESGVREKKTWQLIHLSVYSICGVFINSTAFVFCYCIR